MRGKYGKRDSQRSKVYKMDADFFKNENTLPLPECERIIRNICDAYGVPYPKIKDGRGTNHPYANSHSINLPVFSRKYAMLAHETAHWILDKRLSSEELKETSAHGPIFVKTYLDIYADLTEWGLLYLLHTVKNYRIQMAEEGVKAYSSVVTYR